jgi:hypothetical protein
MLDEEKDGIKSGKGIHNYFIDLVASSDGRSDRFIALLCDDGE